MLNYPSVCLLGQIGTHNMVNILHPPGRSISYFRQQKEHSPCNSQSLEHKSRVILHFLCKCCKSPTNGAFSPLMDEARGSVDCRRNWSSGWRARQLRERHNFRPLLRSLFAHSEEDREVQKWMTNKGGSEIQASNMRAAHDE